VEKTNQRRQDGLVVSWRNGIADGLSLPRLVSERLHRLVLSGDLRHDWLVSDLVNRTNTHHSLHVWYLDLCREPELCQIAMG